MYSITLGGGCGTKNVRGTQYSVSLCGVLRLYFILSQTFVLRILSDTKLEFTASSLCILRVCEYNISLILLILL